MTDDEAKKLATELYNLGAESVGFPHLYPTTHRFYTQLLTNIEEKKYE